MDFKYLREVDAITREEVMRKELGSEKCKIIDKYNLHLNDRLYWERVEDKYPRQEYFSHSLAMKATPLGIIFYINRLCYAKIKYFEKNWEKYIPCTYNYMKGYVESEIYDMEYIKQRSTGIIIDLRELSKIHIISEFNELCRYLEKCEEVSQII